MSQNLVQLNKPREFVCFLNGASTFTSLLSPFPWRSVFLVTSIITRQHQQELKAPLVSAQIIFLFIKSYVNM